MVLKQWRVPNTFRFGFFRTAACTFGNVLAVCSRVVLYVRLPAQLRSLSSLAHRMGWVKAGVASKEAESFRNVLLFVGLSHFTETYTIFFKTYAVGILQSTAAGC